MGGVPRVVRKFSVNFPGNDGRPPITKDMKH